MAVFLPKNQRNSFKITLTSGHHKQLILSQGQAWSQARDQGRSTLAWGSASSAIMKSSVIMGFTTGELASRHARVKSLWQTHNSNNLRMFSHVHMTQLLRVWYTWRVRANWVSNLIQQNAAKNSSSSTTNHQFPPLWRNLTSMSAWSNKMIVRISLNIQLWVQEEESSHNSESQPTASTTYWRQVANPATKSLT